MRAFVSACICMHMCMHTGAYLHVYVCECVFACMCVHAGAYLCVCVRAMCVCAFACLRVCACVHVCACACMQGGITQRLESGLVLLRTLCHIRPRILAPSVEPHFTPFPSLTPLPRLKCSFRGVELSHCSGVIFVCVCSGGAIRGSASGAAPGCVSGTRLGAECRRFV